jgi:ABC-type polysaccharide/polyol phosphate transport system ATPase subunit
VWTRYRRGERHDSLRDLLPALSQRLLRKPHTVQPSPDEFWALADVSFSARPGDAVGIIGPNGAGKSTVLKLLTRIIRPTRGSCFVRGRVGALIELGAGFHPDLTGRENVYLQGSIMGMRRGEIDARFDEIIDFAGLVDWVETPVKRYSSGMQARLGFAVAAHLDPEVLIIDEVLAVGDAAFQRKAYAHIEDMRRRGIPIVVVSHDLDRVARLCTRAVLLDRGTVAHIGAPHEAIAVYLSSAASAENRAEDPPLTIHAVNTPRGDEVRSGAEVAAVVHGAVRPGGDASRLAVSVAVHSAEAVEPVFTTNTALCGVALPAAGRFTLQLTLQMNVPPNAYMLRARAWDLDRQCDVGAGRAAQVRVTDGPGFYGSVQMNPRMLLRAIGR